MYSECLQILRGECHIHQKRPYDVRTWYWTTCCPKKVEERQLFENNIFHLTFQLLLSYKETCELHFSGYFLRCSRKLQTFKILYLGALLGADRSRNKQFAPYSSNLKTSFDQFSFRHFLDCYTSRPISG